VPERHPQGGAQPARRQTQPRSQQRVGRQGIPRQVQRRRQRHTRLEQVRQPRHTDADLHDPLVGKGTRGLLQRDLLLGGYRQGPQQCSPLGRDILEIPKPDEESAQQRQRGQRAGRPGDDAQRSQQQQNPTGQQHQPLEQIVAGRAAPAVDQFHGPQQSSSQHGRRNKVQGIDRLR